MSVARVNNDGTSSSLQTSDKTDFIQKQSKGLEHYNLKYIDDEGECVCVSTSRELKEALRLADQQKVTLTMWIGDIKEPVQIKPSVSASAPLATTKQEEEGKEEEEEDVQQQAPPFGRSFSQVARQHTRQMLLMMEDHFSQMLQEFNQLKVARVEQTQTFLFEEKHEGVDELKELDALSKDIETLTRQFDENVLHITHRLDDYFNQMSFPFLCPILVVGGVVGMDHRFELLVPRTTRVGTIRKLIRDKMGERGLTDLCYDKSLLSLDFEEEEEEEEEEGVENGRVHSPQLRLQIGKEKRRRPRAKSTGNKNKNKNKNKNFSGMFSNLFKTKTRKLDPSEEGLMLDQFPISDKGTVCLLHNVTRIPSSPPHRNGKLHNFMSGLSALSSPNQNKVEPPSSIQLIESNKAKTKTELVVEEEKQLHVDAAADVDVDVDVDGALEEPEPPFITLAAPKEEEEEEESSTPPVYDNDNDEENYSVISRCSESNSLPNGDDQNEYITTFEGFSLNEKEHSKSYFAKQSLSESYVSEFKVNDTEQEESKVGNCLP